VSVLRDIGVCAVLAACVNPGTVRAQTDKTPTFEVASIRPHNPKSPAATMKFLPGGAVSISGMSIKNLIWLAYGLKDYQVLGAPKWLDSELFDIEAKPSPGSAPANGQRLTEEEYLRIQALFADRLQLRIHRETKIQPVYILTIAKGGLKMLEATSRNQDLKGAGMILPWDLFAGELSRRLGRQVIDKTGLKGSWYVRLQYTSDDGRPVGFGVRVDAQDVKAQQGPSIFTALKEQLGLEVQPARGPVESLIIDSVSRPSAN
jgi:uncharacterized protein (TIGR03435 family)